MPKNQSCSDRRYDCNIQPHKICICQILEKIERERMRKKVKNSFKFVFVFVFVCVPIRLIRSIVRLLANCNASDINTDKIQPSAVAITAAAVFVDFFNRFCFHFFSLA